EREQLERLPKEQEGQAFVRGDERLSVLQVELQTEAVELVVALSHPFKSPRCMHYIRERSLVMLIVEIDGATAKRGTQCASSVHNSNEGWRQDRGQRSRQPTDRESQSAEG